MRWTERRAARRGVRSQKQLLRAGPGSRERFSAWLARRDRKRRTMRAPVFRSAGEKIMGLSVAGLLVFFGLTFLISRTPVQPGEALTPIVRPSPTGPAVTPTHSPRVVPWPSPDPGPQTNRAPAGQ